MMILKKLGIYGTKHYTKPLLCGQYCNLQIVKKRVMLKVLTAMQKKRQ